MDEDERIELARRMFAELTCMLEDLAAVAAEGQGHRDLSTYAELTERLRSGGARVALIAEAAGVLVAPT